MGGLSSVFVTLPWHLLYIFAMAISVKHPFTYIMDRSGVDDRRVHCIYSGVNGFLSILTVVFLKYNIVILPLVLQN